MRPLRLIYWGIKMDYNEIKEKIEDLYRTAGEAGNEFSKALMALRSFNYEFDKENPEEVKKAMELGRDIDMRTNYLLRGLLVQHGNVLFL